MKIISWNVNGIRSVYQKGFLDWLKKENPDILCLQEIKAEEAKIPPELLKPLDYYTYINPAKRKGYSGTLIYTKIKPKKIETKIGLKEFDQEGRALKLTYPNFTLINFYLPHGGRAKEKLDYKLKVYHYLLQYLKKFAKQKTILTGDFNIARTDLDLARPKENQNNIMFTPKEREQIDNLIQLGFVDSFRHLYPLKKEAFSWWPYFYNARSRNLGWRIDYTFVSKPLLKNLQDSFILNQVTGSDHCPVVIKIKL